MITDYVKESASPDLSAQQDAMVRVSLIEGSLAGVYIALVIIGVIVTVILRKEVYRALKSCCSSVRGSKRLSGVFSYYSVSSIHETSYVKLAGQYCPHKSGLTIPPQLKWWASEKKG